jgi:hypothetical protein
MNRIEGAAQEAGIKPNRMLDRMVDDWLKGTLPEREQGDDTPWYLK